MQRGRKVLPILKRNTVNRNWNLNIQQQKNKQTVVYSYKGILVVLQGTDDDTCNINTSQKHIEPEKPNTEEYMPIITAM